MHKCIYVNNFSTLVVSWIHQWLTELSFQSKRNRKSDAAIKYRFTGKRFNTLSLCLVSRKLNCKSLEKRVYYVQSAFPSKRLLRLWLNSGIDLGATEFKSRTIHHPLSMSSTVIRKSNKPNLYMKIRSVCWKIIRDNLKRKEFSLESSSVSFDSEKVKFDSRLSASSN